VRGEEEESDEGNINRHKQVSYTAEHEKRMGLEARKGRIAEKTLDPVNLL